MHPSMSESAGTGTSYTNHSLHATSTTRLLQSGACVTEEKSGHCSLTALRLYERLTT